MSVLSNNPLPSREINMPWKNFEISKNNLSLQYPHIFQRGDQKLEIHHPGIINSLISYTKLLDPCGELIRQV